MRNIAVVKTSNDEHALLTEDNCPKLSTFKHDFEAHPSDGLEIGGIIAFAYYKATWDQLEKYLA